MTNNSYNTVTEYPLKYLGNIVWPILFLILFFPLGILLLVLNTAVRIKGVFYSLQYRGSQGWLIFWTIIFFPIAILLGAINGFDVVSHDKALIQTKEDDKPTNL